MPSPNPDVRFPTVLFGLAAVATTLPIFAGYFVSLLLLLWLLAVRWRGRAEAAPADAAFAARAASLLRPLHIGVYSLLGATVLSAVIAGTLDPQAAIGSKVFFKSGHFLVKQGLLWYVLSAALVTAVRRGYQPATLVRSLVLWLAVLAVYAVWQRQTGADWVHGFGAVLPPNRYAYGVYRVSGFMGHPLSLAYNLLLLVLFAFAGWASAKENAADRHDPRPFLGGARAWLAVAGLSLLILGISGSRFPLALAVALPAVALLARRSDDLRRYKWFFAGAALLAAGALYLEGSLLGRVAELFDQSVPLTQRFQRLVFWQAHWRMFLDHPVAGVGVGGYDAARFAYYTALGQHDTMYTAHNIFLQILADSGAIGFLGLLTFCGGFLITARRAQRCSGDAATGLLLSGVLAAGLLQNDLRDSEFLFTLFFLLALAVVGAARSAGAGVTGHNEREQAKNLEPAARHAHSAADLPG
jgi:O-antigen ligase